MDDLAGPGHDTHAASALAQTGPAPYPDYANPDLLDKIPLSCRTILDVGCGQGAMGAAYLRRNPTARVLGIEKNAQSAAQAALRMSEVACLDVETNPMPFAVPEGIDCIIYGDVLQHLVDPWALLKRHAAYLAPGGVVLVCMPNSEHWMLALKLLNGSFDYETAGLLDRTHLRWFTPRTMAAALSDAGLALCDVAPRAINQDNARQFTTAIAPGLRAIGVDPADYLNRATPLQFVWRAAKSAPARIAINATMLEPQGGVSDVRVTLPLRALGSDPAVVSGIMSEPDLNPGLPDSVRIAILHRPLLFGESGIERLRRLLRKDYVIITEFDDHPIFMEQRGVSLEGLMTFTGVHAVQTSTPALAEVLVEQNPEIGIFANGIFELPAVRNFTNPDQLTLFFGAINRGEDWAPLMPALNEVARAVGGRLKFSVLHDKAFFDALDTPHKVFAPISDYPTYMDMLAQADIAFMPLADTVFNRAKSDLKFIEASACRVVSLASAVVYQNSIVANRTGLIFNNPNEMRAHLLRILAYPEAARKVAEAARAYVSEHRMLAYQTADRLAWYRALWERRDELNRALAARVPALFA